MVTNTPLGKLSVTGNIFNNLNNTETMVTNTTSFLGMGNSSSILCNIVCNLGNGVDLFLVKLSVCMVNIPCLFGP